MIPKNRNRKTVSRAYGTLHRAVKTGRLKRPAKCGECSRSGGRIEAHHDNYSKPLDVRWLCSGCHRKRHKRGSGPGHAGRYDPTTEATKRKYIGRKYGRWTITRVMGYRVCNLMVWATCACGRSQRTTISNLTHGLSTQCQNCAWDRVAQSRRTQRKNRQRIIQRESLTGKNPIVGWRVNIPLYACKRCGKPTGGRTKKCGACVKLDRPTKNPISIGTIARKVGISRQGVSDYTKKHGWDQMIRHYRNRSPRQ